MGVARAHVAHDVAAEDDDQSRADRMRGVPHRHLGGQLLGRNPVGEQPRAGREARPLQHAVDHPHDAHEEDQRIVELRTRTLARDPLAHVDAETEGEIGQRAERESRGHEEACVEPVGQNTVDETRKAVDQPVERKENTQAGFRNTQVGFEPRHGQRKVLADEIEERITDHRGDERAHLPVLEAFLYFRSKTLHVVSQVSGLRRPGDLPAPRGFCGYPKGKGNQFFRSCQPEVQEKRIPDWFPLCFGVFPLPNSRHSGSGSPPDSPPRKKSARPAEYPERTKRTCARSNRERSNNFGFRLTDSEKITIFV